MAKIIGNPTVTPMAVPDWNQTDSSKADYIKNKPDILRKNDVIDIHRNHEYPVMKAEADANGNKIHITYATTTALNKILIPGSETIVNRAENDDNGNKIRLIYARKDDVDSAIGDIETSLENIIAKYGLGGDSV